MGVTTSAKWADVGVVGQSYIAILGELAWKAIGLFCEYSCAPITTKSMRGNRSKNFWGEVGGELYCLNWG